MRRVTETELTMTIGGQAVSASACVDVVNPATGAAFASAPECGRDELDRAIAAAEEAFDVWRRDDQVGAQALRRAAKAIMAARDEMVPILVAEQGKPRAEAAEEVGAMALWLSYYGKLQLRREVIQDDDEAFVEVLRKPVGVTAAITPWNFPLVLAAWKIGPALRAGNVLVLKPSPYTPLSTLKVSEILRDVLPPGVLNVVSGGDEVGVWLTSHPAVRKISFTGSIPSGKRVAAAAVSDPKRVTLELGGNDAAIVLDDADPVQLASRMFWAAFYNAGQVCCAIKRVYAPEGLYDEIVEALAQRARSTPIGDGAQEGTRIGPINNEPQLARVKELVSEALDGGAIAAAGGHALDGDGYFFAPTILRDVDDHARIVAEEQFGPALPVLRYRDLDDAIERANATRYGLSGSMWGADPERAAAVAAQLECGTAWVNTHLANAPHQPFGGVKWRGVGIENGPWGLYGFTELQVVHGSKWGGASGGGASG